MIYGRDVAVEYPIMDLYDTGMMNAYLTAVKMSMREALKNRKSLYLSMAILSVRLGKMLKHGIG